MNAFLERAIVALIVGLVLCSATGCRCTPDEKPPTTTSASEEATDTATEATGSAEPTAAATAETSAATPSVGATAAIQSTPTPAPAPAPPTKPPATSAVQLGPTDAKTSWAYLKDMYRKNGTWYVVVDYIQVVGPEETLHFVNENPRLRTFPLSSTVKLLLLKDPGSPDYKSVTAAQFAAFEAASGDEVVEVTPNKGYATQLKEWWAP